MHDKNLGTDGPSKDVGTVHREQLHNVAQEQASNEKTDALANADDDSSPGSEIPTASRVFGSIAGQTTLIGALLFYFGWARTQATLSYFGIDAAIAQLSFSDYMLRSVEVTVRPLVILGLFALVLLYGHRSLSSMLATRQDPAIERTVMLICIVAGVLFCTLGILGFYNWVTYSSEYPFVPIFLGLGVTLAVYGSNVHGLARSGLPRRRWLNGSREIIVVMLDIVLVFWAVSVYADISGRQAGAEVASSLVNRPHVVVYSVNSISIGDPKVKTVKLLEPGNKYHYRYSNLRFLLYSNGRYFLLPDKWKRGNDPVFLLQVNDNIRVEFYS